MIMSIKFLPKEQNMVKNMEQMKLHVDWKKVREFSTMHEIKL